MLGGLLRAEMVDESIHCKTVIHISHKTPRILKHEEPLTAFRGEIPLNGIPLSNVRDLALEVPAFRRAIFSLDHGNPKLNRRFDAFEMKRHCAASEQRKHQVKLARAASDREASFVCGSHTTSPCKEHALVEERIPPPYSVNPKVYETTWSYNQEF